MVCLGFKPGAAGDQGWKAQMNRLKYCKDMFKRDRLACFEDNKIKQICFI